jgi:hypothetical protein
VVVARHTTYGLGELIVTVQGDGLANAQHREFAEPARMHEGAAHLSAEEVGRLFDAFVEEALTEMVFVPQPGHPDEQWFSIELSNAKGERHTIGKFSSIEHKRFERLLSLVVSVFASHLDAKLRNKLTLP